LSWLAGHPVLVEFVPPPRRLGEEGLERRMRRLEKMLAEYPFSAVNLPEIREEPARSSDRELITPFEPRYSARSIAREIRRRFGIPAIINHVVAKRPRHDLSEWLLEAVEDYGVEDFVLVGPSRSGDPPVGPSVVEANAIARDCLPSSARIGNICIPGRGSRGIPEPERMEEKAASGASFFTTQILYHAAPCRRLIDDLAARCPRASGVPLLISLCPLRSAESISFLRWLGVELDPGTAERLTVDPERVLERSIEHLVGVWQRILGHARASGSRIPLGLNIAPVGPVPVRATIALARTLAPGLAD
jgi:5,10-methylenetetrahydrofolate reductase